MGSELARRDPGVLALPGELVEAARGYAEASKAPRTLEAYRRAWLAFAAWCEGAGLEALPAVPATVALYLAGRADAGCKPATIHVDAAAISFRHLAAGLDSPTTDQAVRAVVRGIRRTIGTAQDRKAPLLPADLRAVVDALPASPIGLRDRALLLLGFATAARRSELVALEVADLVFVSQGVEVTIRRSKTDQEGRGLVKAVCRGADPATCPVRAVRAWLATAKLEAGPVFRPVDRRGRIGEGRLSGRDVARIVKRRAAAVGLDAARLAGHSLRRGLATAAAMAGKSERAIMRQTGHRSTAMVRRYIEDADRWTENVTRGIGL